MKGREGK